MSDWQEIQTELLKRQLDLEKVFKLDDSSKEIVMKMFHDLMDSFSGERGVNLPGGMKIDYMRATVFYNTLIEGEYLVTRREKNLNTVLEK